MSQGEKSIEEYWKKSLQTLFPRKARHLTRSFSVWMFSNTHNPIKYSPFYDQTRTNKTLLKVWKHLLIYIGRVCLSLQL